MELIKINKELFLIFNGDVRYEYLQKLLLKKGKNVKLSDNIRNECGIISPTLNKYTVIAIIPFNTCNEDQITLLRCLNERNIIVCGEICSYAQTIAKEKNIHVINILNDKKFCRDNAIITAEGTLANVINNTEFSINKSNILIFGYGNVGKELGKIFYNCNANVCIVSKESAEVKNAQKNHLHAFNLSNIKEKNMSKYSVIINSIPCKNIISNEILSNLRKNTLIIDLASGKENVDEKYCQNNGLKFLKTMSIPGKTAPLTAAEYILSAIERSLYSNLK